MAVDMFLKLDGIKGESADHKHKDTIHIESFSWGMSQTGAHGTGGGGGAGKVSVHDISITKHVDKSSPALMLACCNGKHIKDGLITVRIPAAPLTKAPLQRSGLESARAPSPARTIATN